MASHSPRDGLSSFNPPTVHAIRFARTVLSGPEAHECRVRGRSGAGPRLARTSWSVRRTDRGQRRLYLEVVVVIAVTVLLKWLSTFEHCIYPGTNHLHSGQLFGMTESKELQNMLGNL